MGFLTLISGGMLFLPYILSFIGLSSIGPIAGGLFSTFQGAGIVSGSVMAMTQSFAMSGWAIVLQISTIIFWGIVSFFIFIKNRYFTINISHFIFLDGFQIKNYLRNKKMN